MRQSFRWAILLALGFVFFSTLVIFALTQNLIGESAGTGAPSISSPHANNLPLVLNSANPNPCNFVSNISIPGGTYTCTSLFISSGVTVTALGGVIFYVTGATNISGTLTTDCFAIDLESQGAINVTGAVKNTCSGDPSNAGDLSIHTSGASINLGTLVLSATIQTSGNLDIANDTSIQDWQFDVMPAQRSSSPLPPVCSARADTLEDTVVPGYPIEVHFTGFGADPNGGPVTYAWNFGDANFSAQQNPTHTYAITGTIDVTLTVTDNKAQNCQATLRIVLDDMVTIPPSPGVYGVPDELVVPSGAGASFTGVGLDPQGQVLTYSWNFGDASTSLVASPVHTYTLSGRYPVTLTVTDSDGNPSTALSSIWVYSGTLAQALQKPSSPQGDCVTPGANVFNVNYTPGASPTAGANGRDARLRGTGNVVLGAGTFIHAQDGTDGVSRSGSGDVQGGHGGDGGSLRIYVDGTLIICAGATLENGNGGKGGDATATGTAWARAGNGGEAGRQLDIKATGGLDIQAPFGGSATINPGNGGDGGIATATGDNGTAACPKGNDGKSAKANGGNGGRATKTAIIAGTPTGLGIISITGGKGGAGGAATATGGDGGNATCTGTATGGNGGPGVARGGRGGEAKFNGNPGGMVIAPDAFTAGNGGDATANGGAGGNAIATASSPCGSATATGGTGGLATAFGGGGGAGRHDGNGGNANATGKKGGNATATGGDCTNCGDGGPAFATGGKGGDAKSYFGKAGGSGGSDGTANSNGGNGGNATATGGKGGDCNVCPAGKGGDGGAVTATGGKGGDATGNGNNTGGNGGNSIATGGKGGNGASCCKFSQGGDGGKGGNATSTAGAGGSPSGVVGNDTGTGGNGGNGGDGDPPGTKGSGGIGIGSPNPISNGADGANGSPCVYEAYYIYHSSIPDGVIVPGTTMSLNTYTTTSTLNPPTGNVPTHFLTGVEQGFGTPQYFKNGAQVSLAQGSISYTLTSLSGFPVSRVSVTITQTSGSTNQVRLIGYHNGSPIAAAGNLLTTGSETLTITTPTPNSFFDVFVLIDLPPSPCTFNHWDIVIIDP